MRKTKKTLAVVLALIMLLSTLVVSGSVISADAGTAVKITSVSYNSNATVTLKWSPSQGFAGVQIAKKKAGDKSYTYLIANSAAGSYTDKNVVCGNVYVYQVRPIIKNGAKSSFGSWSNSKSITTLYKPTINSMIWYPSFLNNNWNKIKGATKYLFAFKRTTDKAWNYRETTKNYYNIPNPTKDATYVAQVCPMNGSVKGPWSAVGTAKNAVKPVITYAGQFKGGGWDRYRVQVDWKYDGNSDGFIVFYKSAQDKNWNMRVVTNLPEKTTVFDSFQPNTTYYFQVKPYSAKVYSDVKSFTTPNFAVIEYN